MRLLQVLLLTIALLSTGLLRAAPVDICRADHLDLMPAMQIFEDTQASLSQEEVTQLPNTYFKHATPGWPTQGYSRSAFWLKVQLSNSSTAACSRLLVVGAPRLEDIRVYQPGQDAHAGGAYPLAEWPQPATRQPAFPVSLAAGESATLFIRVASNFQMLLEPELWSEPALLRSQQQTYLSDGLTLGIVLLVVPFGFIVGWILRSQLLTVNAGAIFSYILLTCILNGYLIYWPTALGWTRELLTCASAFSFVLFLAYIRVLLQVARLPGIIGWSYWVPLLGCILGRLWWLKIDPVQGAQIVQISLMSFYGVLLATLFMAWRARLSYNWMAWLVPALLLGQLLMRLFFPQEQLPWQSPQSKYSLSSTLAGVALQVCTLIMEVARSRNREKNALSTLDQQRQAEQERLESTVALRTSQLRESLAARSALMARISHDLRSPLVRIIDYARLLHAGPNRDYQATIERNARQQLELIDEMLEFSHGELEQMQLTLAPGYLYGFLNEIADEAGFLAARQGNTFEAVLADDLPPLVEADFKRLRQILMNLLANAAKFTRNGQIRFEVSAPSGASTNTVELRFSVIDTGIGIDPQEFEQLLQPFRRGRNAQRYEGSGLGLSIVTQLLERMDSRLEPQATGQGSHFSFRLQLNCAQEHDLENGIVDNNATPFDGQGKHVLLVDDIEQNSEWLYDLLAGYGFDVSMAANGEDALACLAEQSIDLLISDQMMPGMDGWELLRQVRDGPRDLPVMLYSAVPPRRPENYPQDLAFDAVLLKPADSRELLACVKALACADTAGPAMAREQ
ncbi:7TM-DISM domain-containing protein [Pseudomonas brassicacearum]|uniref:hybrid sensor histidine kinase/response regulator n=1 Tax=Pseudomonas brassicacearum TaxID=930166 RepID=UPI00025FE89A|nr:7TM-DISM domain-containing protein [Pseudomonas brassicacearum]EIK70894.1 sensor histidine kinase/response regulator [Pseudomonas fluorescens Q8r1-96]KAB0525428.1 response regulator [Pseudomonas brassicacearum subsp. brassicacearum]NJP64408.1 response regulator [Pseudomonas brassicacearum]QEO76927.1 response regulator [Pseudomonas brassicacearum]SDP99431.1 Signal transduction histidine kinase [Pseudomonas brassicacearum]